MMSWRASLYIWLVVAAGVAITCYQLIRWESSDFSRFLTYLLLAALSGGLKVRLPGITGSVSVNFLFLLIAVVQLSLAEALVIAVVCTVVQRLWHAETRPTPLQVGFSVSSVVTAVAAAYVVYARIVGEQSDLYMTLGVILAGLVFFAVNAGTVTGAIALTERRSLIRVWREGDILWSLPHYVGGAALAGLFTLSSHYLGWHTSVLALPLAYLIYRSFRAYLDRLEADKSHAAEMAELHLRTIEALALAIEAKDHKTHDHLLRVRLFALALGREVGLNKTELEALRAAALLHDIGKLGVPDHIIGKPAKLTLEEFEKIKTHPVIGAEILERVQFPYPVVPIVRAHHEKWNGKGYPDGLKGEDIPMGARILSVVDCFDALISDRPYRAGLPLDEAMAEVASQAGESYDPRIVALLQSRYRELDKLAREQPGSAGQYHLSSSSNQEPTQPSNGTAPGPPPELAENDFLSSIVAAREEAHMLFQLTQDLGASLSLDETLSVLLVRVKRLIPFDTAAVYLRKGSGLAPAYVAGDEQRFFSSLDIPYGQGISGWVAEEKKAILNGDPVLECLNGEGRNHVARLKSALSVPLEGLTGVAGVLTLYKSERNGFRPDHLRILMAVSYKLALSIENALKYRQAEDFATTDYLTGLPNARSLFFHLDREIARTERSDHTQLAVLVCDLDGFKRVNDRYGHLEGNEILRSIARALQDNCRKYDYVARLGGDEFVMLLPGLDPEAVDSKMRSLQETSRRASGRHGLELSIGGAFYPGDGSTADELLATADRRMYSSKQKRSAVLEEPDRAVQAEHSVTVH